jgi:uracil-DNA glycosylase
VRIPPSLRNIFKELQRDLKLDKPSHGCLSHWAEQGVLLLNASLTVESGRAGSHQNLGWEVFTDRVIATVRDIGKPIVFMLWGAQARKTVGVLEGFDHCILTAPHPSPLSAHRGFLGCGHFSQANAFLDRCGRGAIDWSLPA